MQKLEASKICPEGAQNPSSYLIEADSGGTLLRNGKFVRLRAEQADSKETQQKGGESTSENADRATEAQKQIPGKTSRHVWTPTF